MYLLALSLLVHIKEACWLTHPTFVWFRVPIDSEIWSFAPNSEFFTKTLRIYSKILENQTLIKKSHAIERHSSDKKTPEYHLCGGVARNQTQVLRVSA